jgi:DNA-binding transcriptional LysR family regulator
VSEHLPTRRPGADLSLRDVRCFVAVLDEHGVRKAAARLGCSASKVSRVVAELEGQLGSPLFVRSGRRIVGVTPLGRSLGPAARELLCGADRFLEQARRLARSRTRPP